MPITLLKKTFMTCSITYFKKQELKKKEEEEEEKERETKILTYNDSIATWSRISIYAMSRCDDPIILD